MGRWNAYAESNSEMVKKYNNECPYCLRKLTGYINNTLFGGFIGIVHRPDSCYANESYFKMASQDYVNEYLSKILPSAAFELKYIKDQNKIQVMYYYPSLYLIHSSRGSFIFNQSIKEYLFELDTAKIRMKILEDIYQNEELWLQKLYIAMELHVINIGNKLYWANRSLDSRCEAVIKKYT